ncbi:MAG: NAD-dependent epimerase/dehydratase family protein [Acidimicrobiales bacterium]
MRVLVSGGSGFIGSHVVDALATAGEDVVAIDRRPPEWPNPKATYLIGDIAAPAVWERALGGVEAVSHQAAKVGLGIDFSDVRDYVADNDGGTAAMLWTMHRRKFRGRIVLASSMAVYGEGRYRCASCPGSSEVPGRPRQAARLEAGMFEVPCAECGGDLAPEAVTEDAPVDPRNVYAATKLHQEHLCQSYAREHDATVVALRYHNVYGPRMPRDTPYAGVASIFRSALEAGRAPEVFEDGRQRRDFVHVADVARANLAALKAGLPQEEGPIVCNVASGDPRGVMEMANVLVAEFGRPDLSPRVSGRFRLGDVRHVFASPERAAEALGFRALVGFEAGMAEFARAPLGSSPARTQVSPRG